MKNGKKEQGPNVTKEDEMSLLFAKEESEEARVTRQFSATKLRKIVAEIVDVVNDRALVTSLEFLLGDDSASNFQFPGCWHDRWENALDPCVALYKKMIDASEKILEENLPEAAEVRHALVCLSNNHLRLWIGRQRLGFYVGALVGAKLMGASREQLLKIGDGVVTTISLQPRFAELRD